METICGIDCRKCNFKDKCNGCAETSGHPFGGECVAAECYKSGSEKYFSRYKHWFTILICSNVIYFFSTKKIKICWARIITYGLITRSIKAFEQRHVLPLNKFW